MLGFKNFESAAIPIAGVGLLRSIHKDQFAVNRLQIKGQAALRSGMLCLPRKSQKPLHLPPSGLPWLFAPQPFVLPPRLRGEGWTERVAHHAALSTLKHTFGPS
jgi:hypothetical protein